MVIRKIQLETVAGVTSILPKNALPEFAFWGRSNVGKSSLLNALIGRKSYARISSEPGKTATVNFYNVNDAFYFVDLPGYGYAKVSEKTRGQWKAMTERYLTRSKMLKRVFLLIDHRHDPGANDIGTLTWLRENRIPVTVVLTKADKLSKSEQAAMEARIAKILNLPREEVFSVSAEKKTGLQKLEEVLLRFLQTSKETTMKSLEFYRDKKVLITGHTGFKGSYLTKILLMAGAKVCGYALEPDTDPALFRILALNREANLTSVIGDVRDLAHLKQVFEEFRPEIVFHLAAQPIVRTSYREPVRTYETNVLGTVNVLECVRLVPGVKTVVNVTTDKVYENFEVLRPYTEEDRLDGYDPYSNSKSCSELVTHSYQRSFLSSLGIAVSTARAGNVIGGGDYAPDRIVPDAVRAAKAGVPLRVRNPYSTRPYQHVFEPLGAYLMLAEETYKHPEKAGAYNIGPDPKNELQTGTMADLFQEAWGEGFVWESTFDGGPHEAGLLKLDSSKIESVFGWKPRLTAAEAVQLVVAFEKAADQKTELETQIRSYFGEE